MDLSVRWGGGRCARRALPRPFPSCGQWQEESSAWCCGLFRLSFEAASECQEGFSDDREAARVQRSNSSVAAVLMVLGAHFITNEFTFLTWLYVRNTPVLLRRPLEHSGDRSRRSIFLRLSEFNKD
jgi:hypothetical protein